MIRELQMVARSLAGIFGVHVHVGTADLERRIQIMNVARYPSARPRNDDILAVLAGVRYLPKALPLTSAVWIRRSRLATIFTVTLTAHG